MFLYVVALYISYEGMHFFKGACVFTSEEKADAHAKALNAASDHYSDESDSSGWCVTKLPAGE